MEVIEKQNYNQSVKINYRDIKCYDRKKLKELYPSGNYSLVGETFEKNKKEAKDTIVLGRKKLNVSEYGKNSKILYKRKGYILVGDNQFLVILQNRLSDGRIYKVVRDVDIKPDISRRRRYFGGFGVYFFQGQSQNQTRRRLICVDTFT